MINIILKFFSIISSIFGLILFSYLPFNITSFLISSYFVSWGIITFFYVIDKNKYSLALKIFSFISFFIALIGLGFSLWTLIILSSSSLFNNFLLIILGLTIFILVFSLISFFSLFKNKLIKNEKNKKIHKK